MTHTTKIEKRLVNR